MSAASLLEQAMKLPDKERAFLADALLDSLNGDDLPPEELAAIDAAWKDEVDRRLELHDSGEVPMLPYDEVMARLRKKNP